jgi:hypothetical protein
MVVKDRRAARDKGKFVRLYVEENVGRAGTEVGVALLRLEGTEAAGASVTMHVT